MDKKRVKDNATPAPRKRKSATKDINTAAKSGNNNGSNLVNTTKLSPTKKKRNKGPAKSRASTAAALVKRLKKPNPPHIKRTPAPVPSSMFFKKEDDIDKELETPINRFAHYNNSNQDLFRPTGGILQLRDEPTKVTTASVEDHVKPK